MRAISMLVMMLLVGCAAAPAPVVQRVEVPVPVPCLASDGVPTKPAYQFDKLSAKASDGEKILALASDWLVGRKYEAAMEAAVAGCR